MNYAITLFGHPFLLRGEWTPDLLAHEQVHVTRQKETGHIKWLVKYVISRSFREQEEVLAYKASIANGLSLADAARCLSTMYLLGITDEQATALLTE